MSSLRGASCHLPAVSVVMSVYNCERYVAEAVESILGQTFTDFEFIIIDDGSTDRSLSILQRFAQRDGRIRLVSRENRGLTRSLNEGLRLARGEFIARMDADDVSLPERFERQVEYLRAHPECVAVGCRVMRIDQHGADLGVSYLHVDHDGIEAHLLRGDGAAMPHPGVMIRRAIVCAVGGYDERYRTAQDLDLFLRLAERGNLANVPDVLLKYRQHLGSTNHERAQEQLVRTDQILRETYRRRGQAVPSCFGLGELPTLPQRYRIWGWQALATGQTAAARRHAICSLKLDPLSSESWRLLYCTLRAIRG